jgi:hypothetical protein
VGNVEKLPINVKIPAAVPKVLKMEDDAETEVWVLQPKLFVWRASRTLAGPFKTRREAARMDGQPVCAG